MSILKAKSLRLTPKPSAGCLPFLLPRTPRILIPLSSSVPVATLAPRLLARLSSSVPVLWPLSPSIAFVYASCLWLLCSSVNSTLDTWECRASAPWPSGLSGPRLQSHRTCETEGSLSVSFVSPLAPPCPSSPLCSSASCPVPWLFSPCTPWLSRPLAPCPSAPSPFCIQSSSSNAWAMAERLISSPPASSASTPPGSSAPWMLSPLGPSFLAGVGLLNA
mmetsp:Transcript_22691/g.35514  ORF Transcript_22691/g.35514 Transcript_22691/m.35514 type:complete len:220 (-) Transcript_22691:620-1279(-)